MSWTGLGSVCDSQATGKMPSRRWLRALCLNQSHESNTRSHRHRISWRTYSTYSLCGQGLSSPPLSLEFCMQAGAAMWKRGLRDGKKRGLNGLSMSSSFKPLLTIYTCPSLCAWPILHLPCSQSPWRYQRIGANTHHAHTYIAMDFFFLSSFNQLQIITRTNKSLFR